MCGLIAMTIQENLVGLLCGDVQFSGRLKMQDRKMTDRKMTDKSAGLENAGLENDGQKCTAGK